jgi:hypothetical protein
MMCKIISIVSPVGRLVDWTDDGTRIRDNGCHMNIFGLGEDRATSAYAAGHVAYVSIGRASSTLDAR